MTNERLPRLVFIHSPIQILILGELIRAGHLDGRDTYVFHRNQPAPQSFPYPCICSRNYTLNDVVFITSLMQRAPGPLEVMLPHSLCYAFHAAEAFDQVRAISYIEEGTGTVYAVHDHGFMFALNKKPRALFDRLKLVVKLAIALRSLAPEPIRKALAADRLLRDGNHNRFIDFDSVKLRHIHGLAAWHTGDPAYQPVPVPCPAVTDNERHVLLAIGKSDLNLPGYWELLDSIIKALTEQGLQCRLKLHPSIKVNSLKGRNRLRDEILASVPAYDPMGDELGFAIVRSGFVGAVSFFSSYQLYAHILSDRLGADFPMLSLERLLGKDDFARKASALPDCGLERNIYFEVDSWLAKIAARAKAVPAATADQDPH